MIIIPVLQMMKSRPKDLSNVLKITFPVIVSGSLAVQTRQLAPESLLLTISVYPDDSTLSICCT